MKFLLTLLLLIPSLSWGDEKQISCDFFLNSINNQEFNSKVQSYRLFNISYLVTSGKTLDVQDFNLSNNFIINLNKISNSLNQQNEFGLLLSELDKQLNQVDIAELNLYLKGWLLAQLQMYSNISNDNNFIKLTTILENGVVLVTDTNYSKINSLNNSRDVFLFYISLADSIIKFKSECN